MRRIFPNGRTRLIVTAIGIVALGAVFVAVSPATQDALGQSGPINTDNPFVVGGPTIPPNVEMGALGEPEAVGPGQAIGLQVGSVLIGIVNDGPAGVVVTPKAFDSSGTGALVVSVQLPANASGGKVELFRPGGQAAEQTVDCSASPCEVSVPDGWVAKISFVAS